MSAVFNTTDRVLVTSTGGVIDPYATVDVDVEDPKVADAIVAGYLVPVPAEALVPDHDGVPVPEPVVPKSPKSAKSTAAPVEE